MMEKMLWNTIGDIVYRRVRAMWVHSEGLKFNGDAKVGLP